MFINLKGEHKIEIIYAYSKTGEWHKENAIENQDFLFGCENEYASFFAIADGVSACKNGADGARIACEVCADIIMDHVSYYFNSANDKVKLIILTNIENAVKKQAVLSNTNPEEYASTLNFVCYNKITEQVLIFSLGDSRIYRIANGKAEYINRTLVHGHNKVCSTISYGAQNEAVLHIFNAAADDSFLLCTDGMWKIAEADGLLNQTIELFDGEDLAKKLDRCETRDDCSFLLVA